MSGFREPLFLGRKENHNVRVPRATVPGDVVRVPRATVPGAEGEPQRPRSAGHSSWGGRRTTTSGFREPLFLPVLLLLLLRKTARRVLLLLKRTAAGKTAERGLWARRWESDDRLLSNTLTRSGEQCSPIARGQMSLAIVDGPLPSPLVENPPQCILLQFAPFRDPTSSNPSAAVERWGRGKMVDADSKRSHRSVRLSKR